MRRPLIVGAHKLYLRLDKSLDYARELVTALRNKKSFSFDIAICPSFINLAHVADILRGSRIGIGAQNVHQEDTGAFTGQVSIQELVQIGVQYIIVGHSELRTQLGETNGMVQEKVKTCLVHNVIPIACVGESKSDRDKGASKDVIEKEIRSIFNGINLHALDPRNVVIAYEPVWAIKGRREDKITKPADPELANEIHEFIRNTIATIYDSATAQQVRILYGGSVDQHNTEKFMREPSIDGLLVGSASTDVESFLEILEVAERVTRQKMSGQVEQPV